MGNFDLSDIKFTEVASNGVYRFLKFVSKDKTYMVKALKAAYRDKRQYRALLAKEFDAITGLHSNSLPVYHDMIDDAALGRCIVMEYIEGRTLAAFMTETHSEEDNEEVARNLMEALQTIHSRFMSHRNLKPSNIIVAKQGNRVWLTNLRPAFADELQVPFTSTRYLAPEQKDETVAVDTRADIYSLGLILKQMSLPDNYRRVADKCCSLGRADRFVDAAEVLEAIDKRPAMNLGKTLKAVAAMAAAALVVGLAVYFIRNGAGNTGIPEPAEATSYMLADTVTADTVRKAAAADTANVANAAVTGSYNVDSVKNVIAARLESIYRPYENDSVGPHAREEISRQVRNCYYGIIRKLGKVSLADRNDIDMYFAKYRKNKDALLIRK